MNNKSLPHNLDAEKEVLTSIFANRNKLSIAMDVINFNDFYDTKHQAIFKTMMDLMLENKPIEVTSIAEEVGKNNIESVGGVTYLYDLSNGALKSTDTKYYAEIVKDKSNRREFIKKCAKIIDMCYDQSTTIAAIMHEISNIDIKQNNKQKIKTDAELCETMLMKIDERRAKGGQLSGIVTGFHNIDGMTKGFERGDLIVVGGRPSMGKTVFTLNLVDGMAEHGFKSLIFELEMSDEKIALRRIAKDSNVDSNLLKMGILEDDQWERVAKACNKRSAENRVFTDTSTNLTIEDIKSRATMIKNKYGLDAIVIDHLEKMNLPVRKDRHDLAIATVTNALKNLAKDLDIAVIVLSQLNRDVESRTDKKPILADLKNSGAIEQDADIVMFLYRDEYYNKDTDLQKTLEVIFAKQRDGVVGTAEMNFYGDTQKISDKFN